MTGDGVTGVQPVAFASFVGRAGSVDTRCTSRAEPVTPERKPCARGDAFAVSQAGSMSPTATLTSVPARARGRVWTTVEGKLRIVRPMGPRRAISSWPK